LVGRLYSPIDNPNITSEIVKFDPESQVIHVRPLFDDYEILLTKDYRSYTRQISVKENIFNEIIILS